MLYTQSLVNISIHPSAQPCSLFIRVLTLTICCLLAAPTALGRDYFVSPGGDDSYPGSMERPWKSVSRVNSFHFKPGDNIRFKRGGIWREPLVIPTSGTKGHYISYGAYPMDPATARPVISCTKDISNLLWPGIIANGGFEDAGSSAQCPDHIPGWMIKSSSGHQCTIGSSDNGNFLKLKNLGGNTDAVTNEFNLRAKGRYRLEARLKADKSAVIHVYLYSNGKKKKHLSRNTHGSYTWKLTAKNAPEPLYTSNGNDWVSLHIPFTTNTDMKARIRISVRHRNGSGWIDNIKLIDLDRNYWSVATGNVKNPRILLLNGKRLSKGTGEWSTDSKWYVTAGGWNTIRYIPDAERPQSLVEVGNHRTGILLDNKSWIRISDLTVTGCESPVNDAVEGAGILLLHGSSNNILSNLLLENNAHGLRIQGKSRDGSFNTNNVIEQIEVANGIDQGIALRSEASHNTIRNSIVHDLNTVKSDHDRRDKEGISLGGNTGTGPGNIVERNEVYNIGNNARGSLGIVAFNSPDTIIRNNHVHDIGANGIGIGANGKSPHGLTSDNAWIYGNVIVRTGISPKAKPGQGIHVMVSDYGDISGTRIYNNTIVDCFLGDSKDGGISIRGVANPDGTVNTIDDTEIFNNIVSGCHGKHPYALYIGDRRIVTIKRLKSDNNLFYTSPETKKGQPFISYMGKGFNINRFPAYRQYSGLDSSSIVARPMFRDIANDDYRLRPDSPAIQSGRRVSTPSDPDGKNSLKNPDIGAL